MLRSTIIFPQTVAQRLTANQVLGVLSHYPVGTNQQRVAWQKDLKDITINQQHITPKQKDRFTQIRAELRDAGLPLNKREWITKLFNLFSVSVVSSVTWDDHLPLPARSTEELTRQVLLRLDHPSKRFRSVPDVVLEELLIRYNKTEDRGIQASLNQLIKVDPLRFSSELGIMYYLKVFEEPAIAYSPEELASFDFETRDTQSILIKQLLEKGASDGRVIPMIKALFQKHPDKIKLQHIPLFLNLTEKFPVLQRLWKVISNNPEFLFLALMRSFDRWGNMMISDDNIRNIRKAGGSVFTEYLKKEKMPEIFRTKNWRLNSALICFLNKQTLGRHIQESLDSPQQEPVELNNPQFAKMTTMCLFDLMMYVIDDDPNTAIRIRSFLALNRATDFNAGQEILRPQNRDLHAFLRPLYDIVSAMDQPGDMHHI